MAQLFQGNPQLMPLIGDLFFRSQDWPMAEDIADRLKLMLPPQILQAEEQDDGQDPKMQAIMQQVEQAMAQKDEVMQAAAQKIQELAQENAQLKADYQTKQAEVMIKGQEVQISQFEAETARLLAESQVQTDQANAQIAAFTAAHGQGEQPERAEPAEPSMDIPALLQAIASMQQPINITVPVQIDGKGQVTKQGRAVRQADGSYLMESVETPVGE